MSPKLEMGPKNSKAGRYLRRWVLAGVSLVLVVVLLVALPQNNPVRAFFATLTRPVQQLVAGWMASSAENADQSKREEQLREENSQLREQISRLELQLQTAEDQRVIAQEAAELAGIVVEYPDYTATYARVIGRAPTTWMTQFTLDCGEQQGIRADAVVVTSAGVVGRVVQVEQNSCVVMAILDGRSNIACVVERTRDAAMMQGMLFTGLEEARCQLQYLLADADIQPGDKLITSGVDQLFPRGLVLGRVASVSAADSQHARVVTVEPAVDFSKLSAVLVLQAAEE